MPISAKASALIFTKGTSSFMLPTCKTTAASVAAMAMALTAGHALAQTAPGAPTAPAAAPVNPLSEGVAVVVNDQIISTYDLRQRMRLLMVTSGVQPTQQAMQQIQQEALRSLIDEHLELQEIRREEKEQKFNIVADDNDVKREIDRIAAGNRMTGDQLLKALANAGVGANTMKEQLRAQVSWARWIQGRYGGSRMKISPDQVNAVIRQLELEAAKPQYQLSEIFLDAARVGGMNVAQDGANQLISQLQQGAPFAAVARQFSSATTAANGGDAGWLTESQIPPEIRDAVLAMRPGQLSQPIAGREGVYIVYLRDKRAGSGDEMVTLKQAAISLAKDATADQVEAARQKLMGLKQKITTCAEMETKANAVDGVLAGDLGEAGLKDLAPAFRDAIQGLQVNQVSDPIRTDAGLHLIAVCGRRQGGVELPTKEEIEERLQDQQLSMVSKRYLRDLKNSATIEFP